MTVYDGNGNEISSFVDGSGNNLDRLIDGTGSTIWEYSDGTVTGDINLANELPQYSVDIHDSYPDFRSSSEWNIVSAEDYDGRSGDVGELAQSVSNDTLVDLGDGEYNVSTTITGGGGYIGDGATLYYTGIGNDLERGMLFTHLSDKAVIEGVTIDITSTPSTGTTSDCGILESYGIDEIWIRDLELRGARQRIQDIDGSAELTPGWTTLLLQVNSTGTAYADNVVMTDGSNARYDVAGSGKEYDHTDHAYSLHCDPSHEGDLVLKDCHIRNWSGNGYYTMNAPGRTTLWSCISEDCARGNFRPAENDDIIAGRSEITALYDKGRNGTPFVVSDDIFNTVAVGLEIIADGDNWGNNVMEARDNAGEMVFDRCIFHIKGGDSSPLRMDAPYGPADVTYDDCWILDEGGAPHTFYIGTWPGGGSSGIARLEGENNIEGGGSEFDIASHSTLHHGGEEYSDTTLSASELNISSVEEGDWPEFYVDIDE